MALVWMLAAVVGLVYVGLVAAGVRGPVRAIKVIPALALAVATGRLHPAIPAGFVLSALGDGLLLDKSRFLLAGLGAFLLAHLAFVAGFVAQAPPSLPMLGVAVAAAVTAVAALWRSLRGVMRVAVPVYALALAVMAAAAAGLGTLGLVGGVLFLVSDTLLAVHNFKRPLPAGDVLVMSTYYAAILLLAVAVHPIS